MQWPTANSIPVAYLLTFFFVIEGIATIMYALEHRRELSGRWEWMVASGCVDLALATLVVLGLPGTAPLAIGILVGVNMVLGGSRALIAHGNLCAYRALSKILSGLAPLFKSLIGGSYDGRDRTHCYFLEAVCGQGPGSAAAARRSNCFSW